MYSSLYYSHFHLLLLILILCLNSIVLLSKSLHIHNVNIVLYMQTRISKLQASFLLTSMNCFNDTFHKHLWFYLCRCDKIGFFSCVCYFLQGMAYVHIFKKKIICFWQHFSNKLLRLLFHHKASTYYIFRLFYPFLELLKNVKICKDANLKWSSIELYIKAHIF